MLRPFGAVFCRVFSSSLTLREVIELLFAVGARRWRLVKSLVDIYQVRMNGEIRQAGVSHNSPFIHGEGWGEGECC